MCCDAWTDFLVKPFGLFIACVDPDIAAKKVGENNTWLFSGHWPGDEESILPIVTSVVDTRILSIVNAAIASLPDRRRIVWVLWGCLEEPNGEGGLYACNVTSIFDNTTAARWVKAAMQYSNPMLFCIVYRGQQADGTACAQTPMRGGNSYLPLDDIHPPPAEDMIDSIGEESNDDGDKQRPNPRSFPTMKPGFQRFECMLETRIIRQQRYLEVIRNRALVLFADFEQTVVADEDVAWLRKQDHIVKPPTAGSLPITKRTSSHPAANQSL